MQFCHELFSFSFSAFLKILFFNVWFHGKKKVKRKKKKESGLVKTKIFSPKFSVHRFDPPHKARNLVATEYIYIYIM